MFKFSSKLHVWKNRVKKNGNSTLYLEIYISRRGNVDRDFFNINLEWPLKFIDFDNAMLLPRGKNDTDVNDYNMIIMSERAKFNEIAKLYRLANRVITIKTLKRELVYFDSSKSVIGYCKQLRSELFKKRLISEQTYKHYGTTIGRIEEFQFDIRFDELNKRWVDSFKSFLKKKGNAHNTVWTRIKEFKAMMGHANNEINIFVDPSVLNYKNQAVKTPTTFLNKDEVSLLISSLKSLYLSDTETNVLKAFLFSCFTSLRISDVYAADKGWFLSDNFLVFTMQKNKERAPKMIKIPIAPIARDFIHGSLTSKLFNLPTQQEYNRTLKDIAIKVGIKKRLTSHVGRHTFGYLFMTSVGDIFALKEIMGHSKIETTQRYAHLDEEYKMEQVKKIQQSFI